MDGERFDRLARRLARAQSRRALLAGFMAGAAATVLGRDVAAQLSAPCYDSNGQPLPRGTSCVDPNNPCIVTGECDGTFPECRPVFTEPAGTPCGTQPAPCQDIPKCNSSGQCVPGALKPAGAVCREAVDACHVDDECSGDSADCEGCTFPTPDPFICRIDDGVLVPYQPTPVNCDDGNACTTDNCDPSVGCFNTPITCQPSDACYISTGCDPVAGCQEEPLNCDDGDACTTDSCDPLIGCVNTPIACPDDGNPCTSQSCQSGACMTTNLDDRPCGEGGTCSGGACIPPSACGMNEVLCGGKCLHKSVFKQDDGNCGGCGIVCSGGRRCRGGTCKKAGDDVSDDEEMSESED